MHFNILVDHYNAAHSEIYVLRLRDHIDDRNNLPILIFPEGKLFVLTLTKDIAPDDVAFLSYVSFKLHLPCICRNVQFICRLVSVLCVTFYQNSSTHLQSMSSIWLHVDFLFSHTIVVDEIPVDHFQW